MNLLKFSFLFLSSKTNNVDAESTIPTPLKQMFHLYKRKDFVSYPIDYLHSSVEQREYLSISRHHIGIIKSITISLSAIFFYLPISSQICEFINCSIYHPFLLFMFRALEKFSNSSHRISNFLTVYLWYHLLSASL